MQREVSTVNAGPNPSNMLAPRVRAHLCQIAGQGRPITYQALAKALALSPPNTIQQLTVALECLIEEDAAAAYPLIAALVISKTQGGLPAGGFFDCARHVGRFDGDPLGPEGAVFHTTELKMAVRFWGTETNVGENGLVGLGTP